MYALRPAACAALAAAAFCTGAQAADIVLEHTAVDKLVASSLFTNAGRLDLKRGPCYAYLDSPSVALTDGRIRIHSHLVARLGADSGGACLGVSVSSWSWVSGRPTANGGVVRLEDLRIDSVDDAAVGMLLDSALLPVFPRAFELDVAKAVRDMLRGNAGALQATVDALQIDAVSVADDRLSIRFNFKLTAR
jgi:hypothetical protein